MCSRVFSPVLKKGLPVSNHMSVTVYGCKIKTYFLSDKCFWHTVLWEDFILPEL